MLSLAVNSSARVTNLNADRLDGKDITAFDAQKVINAFGPLPRPAGTHTITLQAKNSSACNTTGERVFDYYTTTTNGDDTFYVNIVEIPD